MSDKELEKAMQFQIPEHFNPDEIYLTWQKLALSPSGDRDGKSGNEIVYALAKRSLVDALLSNMMSLGIELATIDLDVFALQNIYKIENEVSNKIIALLNVGAACTSVNVHKDGCSVFAGEFSFGGDDFTHSIQNKLGLTFEEAEKIKTSKEFIVQNNGRWESHPHLKNGVDSFLAELKRFFDRFRKKFQDDPIKQILLSGGSVRLKNIDQWLEQELGIPAAIMNPAKNIKISAESGLVQTHPEYNVAIGLALRGLVKNHEKN